MSKRALIVHGWGATPLSDWFPWLKRELLKRGYVVDIPEMPNTHTPTIEAWVAMLALSLVALPEESILIGHSIGCQTILRTLERLPENRRFAHVILVAPWVSLTNLETSQERKIATPWLKDPIRWDRARSHADDFVCFFSGNDTYVPRRNRRVFQERLDAEVVTLKDRHHFDAHSGILEIPELLEKIISYNFAKPIL